MNGPNNFYRRPYRHGHRHSHRKKFGTTSSSQRWRLATGHSHERSNVSLAVRLTFRCEVGGRWQIAENCRSHFGRALRGGWMGCGNAYRATAQVEAAGYAHADALTACNDTEHHSLAAISGRGSHATISAKVWNTLALPKCAGRTGRHLRPLRSPPCVLARGLRSVNRASERCWPHHQRAIQRIASGIGCPKESIWEAVERSAEAEGCWAKVFTTSNPAHDAGPRECQSCPASRSEQPASTALNLYAFHTIANGIIANCGAAEIFHARKYQRCAALNSRIHCADRSLRSFTDLLLLAEQASLTGECTKHPAESRWALVSSALERIFRGRLIEPFSRCPGRAPNPPIT